MNAMLGIIKPTMPFLQFYLYGMILLVARKKNNLRNAAVGIALLHLAAVLTAIPIPKEYIYY